MAAIDIHLSICLYFADLMSIDVHRRKIAPLEASIGAQCLYSRSGAEMDVCVRENVGWKMKKRIRDGDPAAALQTEEGNNESNFKAGVRVDR